MANHPQNVGRAIHATGQRSDRRPEPTLIVEKPPDLFTGDFLEEHELSAAHSGQKVAVHHLLGMGPFWQHEQWLAQVQRLADELIAGRRDHGRTAGEIIDESLLVDRVKRHVANVITMPQAVDLYRHAAVGQRFDRRERRVATEVGNHIAIVPGNRAGYGVTEQWPYLHHMLPATPQRRPKESRHHRIGGFRDIKPHRMAHEPGVPLQCPRQRVEVVGQQEVLMVDTHQRNPFATGGPGKRRLEIGDRQVGAEGLEFADQPVDQRAELPSLVIEPRRDRPHHVESPARILKDDAGDLTDIDTAILAREPTAKKPQGIGRGIHEHLMLVDQVLDQSGDPRGVTTALSTYTDCDSRHGCPFAGRSVLPVLPPYCCRPRTRRESRASENLRVLHENCEMRVSVGWVVAWSGLMAAAVACTAAEPNEVPIARLIQRLSAASATTRDAAERALLDLGPAVLPQVVAAHAGAAGEAAFRLRCIQQHLEEMATAERVEAAIDTLTFRVDAVEPLAHGRRVRLALRVAWGPTLEPLAMRLPAHTIMADGPAGESLTPVHRKTIVEPLLTPGATGVSLPVTLVQIDPPLESLATLRGTVTLWIAGRDHDFEVPLDGPHHPLRVGRATVTLVDAAVRDGRLEVTAGISFDEPSEALASHHSWLVARQIDVVTDSGQPFVRSEQRTAERSERGLTVIASFALPTSAAGLRGLRMRWRLPMAIHEVPVDFLVRDVPLPLAAD